MQKILLAISLFNISNHLFALEFDELIVIQSDNSNRSLNQTSSNVEVLTEKDINKYQNLNELLKFESSLFVTNSGPKGSMSSVFLRGTDSAHTLFVIDGVVVNDPSNPNRQYDFSKLSLSSIAKIEILKGSQSLLYGANAIGGVIYITTKKAQKANHVNAGYEYSSFDTHNTNLAYGKKTEDTNFLVALDYQKTQGFSAAADSSKPNDKDGNRRINLSGKITQDLTPTSYTQLDLKYIDAKDDLDKGAFNDDPNDYLNSREFYFNYRYHQKNDSSNTWFDISNAKHDRSLHVLADQYDNTSKLEFTKSNSKTASLNHQVYFSELFTTLFKVEYSSEEMKINGTNKSDNENIALIVNNDLSFDKSFLSFGARLDHNDIFSNNVNGKISYIYEMPFVHYKINLATGLKTPTLYQLFDPNYGNKNLNPEKSASLDMGADFYLTEKSKISTSLFNTYIYDRHSYDPQTYISINEGRSNIYGTELIFNQQFNNYFYYDLSYTYLHTEDLETHQSLLRRPEHSVALKLKGQYQNHFMQMNSKWTSSRFDFNQSYEREKVKDFMIFDLFYEYQVNKNLSLKAKAQNLFNKKYQEVLGLNSLSRSFSAGFNMNF